MSDTTETSKNEIELGTVNELPRSEPAGEIGGESALDFLHPELQYQLHLTECDNQTAADRRRYRIEHGL